MADLHFRVVFFPFIFFFRAILLSSTKSIELKIWTLNYKRNSVLFICLVYLRFLGVFFGGGVFVCFCLLFFFFVCFCILWVFLLVFCLFKSQLADKLIVNVSFYYDIQLLDKWQETEYLQTEGHDALKVCTSLQILLIFYSCIFILFFFHFETEIKYKKSENVNVLMKLLFYWIHLWETMIIVGYSVKVVEHVAPLTVTVKKNHVRSNVKNARVTLQKYVLICILIFHTS